MNYGAVLPPSLTVFFFKKYGGIFYDSKLLVSTSYLDLFLISKNLKIAQTKYSHNISFHSHSQPDPIPSFLCFSRSLNNRGQIEPMRDTNRVMHVNLFSSIHDRYGKPFGRNSLEIFYSIAVSVFIVILVGFDKYKYDYKYETSRHVLVIFDSPLLPCVDFCVPTSMFMSSLQGSGHLISKYLNCCKNPGLTLTHCTIG